MDNENTLAIGLIIILVIFFIGAEIYLYDNTSRTDNTTVNNNQIVNYCPYCGHKLNKIRGGNYENYRK